jgi:hypothetical protein
MHATLFAMRWLIVIGAAIVAAWVVRAFLAARKVAAATPALRLAGGPPDGARADGADEASAGRPLLDAIADVLRERGAEVAAIEAEDWGVAADAVVGGQELRLKLGAHGANGVGPEWLLVLDGADDNAALRRVIEEAAGAVAGVKVIGWDD